jgi:hypothetical protein
VAYKRPADGEQKLTKKQEKLARAVVKDPGASLRDLGKRAGYEGNDTNNPHVVYHTLNKPHVKARIRELMDMSPKLQIPGLLTKLEEGLDATETKFFAHQGEVVSERETIDYSTRRAYLDTALELQGVKERTDAGVTNNFFTKDAIEAFVDAFKRKLGNGDNT